MTDRQDQVKKPEKAAAQPLLIKMLKDITEKRFSCNSRLIADRHFKSEPTVFTGEKLSSDGPSRPRASRQNARSLKM